MSAARGEFLSTVAANVPLCREHFRLTLRLNLFPPTEPGQFIQIDCRDTERPEEVELELEPAAATPDPDAHQRDLIAPSAFLRRPFSVAGRRDQGKAVELEIIHRVVGVGTEYLSRLREGDRVSILGPLGNRFTLPPAGSTAILVGGGVGIPPMLYLAEKLAGRAIAFCGATTRDLIPLTLTCVPPDDLEPRALVEEFSRHNILSVVTTDDGSYGFRGYVTDALERYLDRSGRVTRDSGLTMYTCGPEPMMKRVAQIALERRIPCQIAVERAMACGMGTCQSCCIRVRKPDPSLPPLPGSDWCYRLACTDGPIFAAADLLW